MELRNRYGNGRRQFRSTGVAFTWGAVTGFSFASLVLVVSLLTTIGAQFDPLGGEPAGADSEQEATIDMEAEHLGGLEISITSQVTSSSTGEAVSGADIVAYTDMVEMPLTHREGPIPLKELRGAPGRYFATTWVPMVGQYDVEVVLRSPLEASDGLRLDVNAAD